MAVRIFSVLLFVYTCFNGIYSEVCTDQLSMNVRLLELEIQLLQLKTKQCQQYNGLNEISQPVKTPNIAFRSYLGSSISPVKSGDIIAFDQIELNEGNAYNGTTGVFTAPVNGTYMFSMKLGNPTNKPGAFFLVQSKGYVKQYLEYVIAGHTRGWNVGGASTVTKLVEGESVYVEGEGSCHGNSGYGDNRFHSTFSGVLLHSM